MGCPSTPPRTGRFRPVGVAARLAATAAALALTASCTAGPPGNGTPSAGTVSETASISGAAAAPVTAEINQLRDNYSRQIIAVQLTNTTAHPVTVLSAAVASPLFSGTIAWQAPPGGTELPPGQTKILPAQLRAPVCAPQASPPDPEATASFHLAEDGDGPATTVPATDPYGVMVRNNTEMCLSQAVAAVAGIRLLPDLEVVPGSPGAVLTLAVTPRAGAGTVAASEGLTIIGVDGTTLLDEDPAVPWPESVRVRPGDADQWIRLGIRPARCDPHAIADDKVGTLVPVRVSVDGREGVVKFDAGPLLRGRIYDFITAACGRQ